MRSVRLLHLLPCILAVSCAGSPSLEPIRAIRGSSPGFVLENSGAPFVPWGFNYDHDERGRLLEDYWDEEWPKVESDFAEILRLGANVVRIHLQLGKFLSGPGERKEASFERLSRLLRLAGREGIRLDITGLGCYRASDVPAWYDALSEADRWEVQARFWREVAQLCRGSPAVFCYDLMNEPVVPGGRRDDRAWLGPPFGEYHYVQCITLDQAGRPRPEIAGAWVRKLVSAIRDVDERALITVGLVPWSLDRPGLTSGFVPSATAADLDFISVHIYPRSGKLEEDLDTLRGFAIGKPVLVEETFPLECSPDELRRFLSASREVADGWIGFYWGRTPEELRGSAEIADALVLAWLELFRTGPPR